MVGYDHCHSDTEGEQSPGGGSLKLHPAAALLLLLLLLCYMMDAGLKRSAEPVFSLRKKRSCIPVVEKKKKVWIMKIFSRKIYTNTVY